MSKFKVQPRQPEQKQPQQKVAFTFEQKITLFSLALVACLVFILLFVLLRQPVGQSQVIVVTATPQPTPFVLTKVTEFSYPTDDPNLPTSSILPGAVGTVVELAPGQYQILATVVLPSGEIAYPGELTPVTPNPTEDAELIRLFYDSLTRTPQ